MKGWTITSCPPFVSLSHDNSEISPPAVANGVVYVGNSGGNFDAIDATTDAKLWIFKEVIRGCLVVPGYVVVLLTRCIQRVDVDDRIIEVL
jgi:outer membrane protein assembly factor BamB